MIEWNDERRLARELVLRYGWNTLSYQILNPGIALWFTEDRQGVVGYVRTRTHLVAAGSPVSPEGSLAEAADAFRRFAAAQGRRVCFFGAQERLASLLRRRSPVSLLPLGAQPVWHPRTWLRNTERKASLRAQLRRAANKGTAVTILERPGSGETAALRRCLTDWLSARPLPPLHFLVEPDTLSLLDDRIVAAARTNGRLAGFCIATPVPRRNGWLIEQTIRHPSAPNGTAELLLQGIVSRLSALGASMVTLGLAPLSPAAPADSVPPLPVRAALTLVRRFGEPFYHFRGLEAFKAKFEPEGWEPVYAVTNEPSPSLAALHAVAAAFTAAPPFRFLLRSAVRAAAAPFRR